MSTVNWILLGIGSWCAVSVGVGVIIGRFLQAGQRPRPVDIFRVAATRQRVRALARPTQAGADDGVAARPRPRRRPTSRPGPGPAVRPSESPSPATSSPRHGPRRPAPVAAAVVHSHPTKGAAFVNRLRTDSALLTWTDDVASDDLLLDRVAATPLSACPLVDDGAGGELASRLMEWRRQVEMLNVPTQRRPARPD